VTAYPSIVVFDIGGVLIDWNPRYLYRKLFAEDEAAMERFLAEICTADWNLEQDRGRDWDEAVRELSARYPEQAELIAAYHLRWEEMAPGPIPGTEGIVAALEARGVPLYCITNFSPSKLEMARRRFPVLDRFRGTVVSGVVGLVKPDPAIYRRLLDDHGLKAADCLFIDDVGKNVAGAQAVGMHAVRFTSAPALEDDLRRLRLLD
jgi:2-haloacid dehalogenase